jgi:hypothetical protein
MESDQEVFDRLKDQGEYLIDIKKPRNYRFHKKVFALFNVMFNNQDRFEVKEVMIDYIKIKAGIIEDLGIIDGKLCYKVKSISYAAMDEFEFNDFYVHIKRIAWKEFMPNSTEEEIDRAVAEYMRFE